MADHPAHLAVYRAHRATVQIVHGLIIQYGLTLDGPPVEATHSELDATLPEHSMRVRAGSGELMIRSEQWVGRSDELRASVMSWLLGHLDLQGVTVRKGARRPAPVWMEVRRAVNPAGR